MHPRPAGFDFEGSPVDRKLVHTLAEVAFTEPAHNVVLVDGPGTGKTHLVTAIGVSGITRHGKRVRVYSTVNLGARQGSCRLIHAASGCIFDARECG